MGFEVDARRVAVAAGAALARWLLVVTAWSARAAIARWKDQRHHNSNLALISTLGVHDPYESVGVPG